MPANSRSLTLTDLYRQQLLRLSEDALNTSLKVWPKDLADFDSAIETWLAQTTSVVARAQRLATRASLAYVSAFLSSELGRRARTPVITTAYAGVSRDGRTLPEAYDTARIGVLVALEEGLEDALDKGWQRAQRAIDLDVLHAGRQTTLELIEADDRFEGWQRVVRGTCGACAGKAKGPEGGLMFQVHPGCKCVSEPVVKGAPNRFPRPTGAELFAAKAKDEQDEMLGPEAAELVRSGAIELSDLVEESPLSTAENFITQKPLEAL